MPQSGIGTVAQIRRNRQGSVEVRAVRGNVDSGRIIAMSSANLTVPSGRLPPTTAALLDDGTRPYFLWWTRATVGQLK